MTTLIILGILWALAPLIIEFVQTFFYYLEYKKSIYKSESGNTFKETFFDINKRFYISTSNKGNIGEFFTFLKLEKFKDYKKLLTNNYVSDENNLTHESDIIMIHSTGIYVFESKNYSGWIYGKETDRYWNQSIYNEDNHKKYKTKFYNPIWQNKRHIDILNEYLENKYVNNIYSYIVFSNRCKLKRLNYSSAHCKIMNRYDLLWNLRNNIKSKEIIFTNEQIDEIYDELKKCSNVSVEVKQQHIDNINCGAYYLNKKETSQETVSIVQTTETIKTVDCLLPTENIPSEQVIKQKSYDKIIEELRKYRKTKSTLERVPAYFIYNDETMFMLANMKPKNLEELKHIKGLNDYKITKYGGDILKAINNLETN